MNSKIETERRDGGLLIRCLIARVSENLKEDEFAYV